MQNPLDFLLRLTIGRRLAIFALSAMAMIAIVGSATLPHLARMTEQFAIFHDHPHRTTNTAREMKYLLIQERRNLREAIADPKPEQRKRAVLEMDAAQAKFLRELAVVNRTYLGPRSDVADIETNFRALVAFHREVLDVRADSGSMEQAWEMTRDTAPGNPSLAVIAALDKVSAFAEGKAVELNQSQRRTYEKARTSSVVLLGIAILMMTGISVLLMRSITVPLRELRASIVGLSNGNLDLAVPYQDMHNETGDFSRAIAVLQRIYRDNEAQRWVKTHVAEVSAAMQQPDTPVGLAQVFLSRTAPLLRFSQAVLYQYDERDGLLRMVAGYGHQRRKHLNNAIRPGEGLVGQCLVENAPITVTSPPQDYIAIDSGLGSAAPGAIAILPVALKGRILGVLEVAALHRFEPRELDLLDALVPALAANIEILGRTHHTGELLADSRKQAESLEKQAARLEEQTVELEAQQASIKATEQWFRGIIDVAPDGMLVADEHGTIMLANPQLESMFGYDAGELAGQSVEILVPPPLRSRHPGLREGFMQVGGTRPMGALRADLQGVRKDGSQFPVEIGLSRLPAGGGRGICACASVRDVTERKAATKASGDEHARPRSVSDTRAIDDPLVDGTDRVEDPSREPRE